MEKIRKAFRLGEFVIEFDGEVGNANEPTEEFHELIGTVANRWEVAPAFLREPTYGENYAPVVSARAEMIGTYRLSWPSARDTMGAERRIVQLIIGNNQLGSRFVSAKELFDWVRSDVKALPEGDALSRSILSAWAEGRSQNKNRVGLIDQTCLEFTFLN